MVFCHIMSDFYYISSKTLSKGLTQIPCLNFACLNIKCSLGFVIRFFSESDTPLCRKQVLDLLWVGSSDIMEHG